ncbi:MAG: patatin-like phospholipase family protein, partial [Candidatus Aenigmarchaeota archaeon]|nr:patatin-like phospholipase family protein [Candidatus Aenigmarchaeota archaeon]
MTKNYFCIFAGGGVRGTAYVGALKALEEMEIEISGLAGSSVGALFASLVAVGYTQEEIKNLFYDINYQIFKDLYIPFGKDFGFFKGDEVYSWVKNKIEYKFYGNNKNENSPPVTFKDLDKELVIVA